MLASAMPVLDFDPFADEALANPYGFHDAVRNTGAWVWLEPIGCYASGRYAEVQAALKDWPTSFPGAASVWPISPARSRGVRPRCCSKPIRRCTIAPAG